ncbi:Mu transposase C-terminal domain-containing protein [Sphingomonas sp. NCPPB 2930]
MIWLTARELAGLPGMPSTERRTRDRLLQLRTPHRPRPGRGGGSEYDCAGLPAETRNALMLNQIAAAGAAIAATAEASAALPAQTRPVASASVPVPALNRRPPSLSEKACADARLILVTHMLDLARFSGTTKASQLLALQLASGECTPELQEAARTANQRARKAAVAQRTLFRWMAAYQGEGWWGLLPAPAAQERVAALDEDVAAVLGCYHSKDARFRNLTDAAKHVTRQMGADFDTWSALYGRARRALGKVNNVDLIKARNSGSQRAALLPHVRRSTQALRPLDVCVIDGHSFKAKVRHPDHGAPFSPETTLVMDVATRMVCGWSCSLSENTIAVGDAIRHAIGNVGIFGIVYSDNGAGEKAKVFDCPVDGIIKRLGSEHRTGRPGNPQGRGVIERSWRTHMIQAARQFGSYQGSDVDEGTLRKVSAALAKEQRAIRRADQGEVITLSAKAPSWQQFVEAVDAAIVQYNTEHRHRGLPKRADGKHMTPAEAWQATFDPALQERLEPATLRDTFMPSMLRTARRGEVTVFNQHYQADALMDRKVDGRVVSVRYDIHDPHYVMVYTTEGEFVCEAKWNASSRDFFPKPVVLLARERRVAAAIKLREQQIETALRELQPSVDSQPLSLPEPTAFDVNALVMEAATTSAFLSDRDAVPVQQRPFFDTASERYEWLMAQRGDWTDGDTEWVRSYVQSDDYEGLADYYQSRGMAWSDQDSDVKSAQPTVAAGGRACL